MISHTSTKDDILRAIRRHCCKCVPPGLVASCTENGCDLWPHRLKRVKDADPTHLFKENDKERFIAGAVAAARTLAGPFTMQNVRKAYGVQPLSQNWWGGATASKEWRQAFSRTGRVPTSGAPEAKRRRVVEWQPRLEIQKKQLALEEL